MFLCHLSLVLLSSTFFLVRSRKRVGGHRGRSGGDSVSIGGSYRSPSTQRCLLTISCLVCNANFPSTVAVFLFDSRNLNLPRKTLGGRSGGDSVSIGGSYRSPSVQRCLLTISRLVVQITDKRTDVWS